MKKLNKIKLTALNRNEIADREQRMLKGGVDYKCGCMAICLDELCMCIEEGGYDLLKMFTIVMQTAIVEKI